MKEEAIFLFFFSPKVAFFGQLVEQQWHTVADFINHSSLLRDVLHVLICLETSWNRTPFKSTLL